MGRIGWKKCLRGLRSKKVPYTIISSIIFITLMLTRAAQTNQAGSDTWLKCYFNWHNFDNCLKIIKRLPMHDSTLVTFDWHGITTKNSFKNNQQILRKGKKCLRRSKIKKTKSRKRAVPKRTSLFHMCRHKHTRTYTHAHTHTHIHTHTHTHTHKHKQINTLTNTHALFQ